MENTSILLICMGILLLDIIIFLIFKICDMRTANNNLQAELDYYYEQYETLEVAYEDMYKQRNYLKKELEKQNRKSPYEQLPFAVTRLSPGTLCANFSIIKYEEELYKERFSPAKLDSLIKEKLAENFKESLIRNDLIKYKKSENYDISTNTYTAYIKIAVED